MQTVNVTNIKKIDGITKTGPKAGEPYELIIIIGDDGSEFSTFDKAAKEVGIGGVIELEPVIKAGKTNFTKFNIISKGTAPGPALGESMSGESPEKRRSIEDQSRAQRITELWIAGKLEDGDILKKKLRTWLEKLGSPDLSPKTTEPTKGKAPPTTPKEGENWPPLKNKGELFTRAQSYGLSTRDVLESVGVGKPEEIIDLDEAWTSTAKRFASAIEATTKTANEEVK